MSRWYCKKVCVNRRVAEPLRPSLALGHLPCEGRLFARASPAGKAPRNAGSWPSLRGLRGSGTLPCSRSKIQRLRQLAQGFAVSQFLQGYGIILGVFCGAKFHTAVTDFHIQNCAAHDRSALRNQESAIAAPLFRQLPQWSNLLRHDTLRMTKFVCSAVPLPFAGSTRPQAAGPACKEENHGKKRNRWSVRRPHLGHQRKPGRRV